MNESPTITGSISEPDADMHVIATDEAIVEGKACSISSDPDCEVCQ